MKGAIRFITKKKNEKKVNKNFFLKIKAKVSFACEASTLVPDIGPHVFFPSELRSGL